MIHAIIGEIVILEIKVVEIVCTRFNFLTLQYSNQLSLCLLESNHDFSIFSNKLLSSS